MLKTLSILSPVITQKISNMANKFDEPAMEMCKQGAECALLPLAANNKKERYSKRNYSIFKQNLKDAQTRKGMLYQKSFFISNLSRQQKILKLRNSFKLGMIAHDCNPRNLGG